MISYYWPPCGGPGALRPVKFAKYLSDNGIEPVVLTRKDIAYHTIDRELGNEIKDVRVIRTESFDPARLLYIAGMRRYNPRSWQRPIKQGLNFPDHKLPWFPFAYPASKNMDFDCIYVTAPPFSAFLLGYAIAYARRKPLILDFRDSWLQFPFMPYKGILQRSFVHAWEKKVVHAAHAIIAVDENIKRDLVQRYPGIDQKTAVIPNGYDPMDLTHADRPTTFTLSYLGTVRKERDPNTILKAVHEAQEEYKIQDITFKFIGHIEKEFLQPIAHYPFVRILGHLPHTQALHDFAQSHCGIMITTGSTYFFPSRQNEYLASGLPLIVCGESKGLHLLEKAFTQGYPGWVFQYNDIEGMKKRIGMIYQDFKKGKVLKGKTPYTQYTRQNLTTQLAQIIKKTLNINI